MKIIINKNTYFNLLIYLVGILHWIFFFYFVDYYEYNNENIFDEIKIINEKTDDFVAVSVNKIGNSYLDNDKDLIKSFIEKPNLQKLFKYKKFNYSDWKSEHKAYEVYKYSLNNKKTCGEIEMIGLPNHLSNFGVLPAAYVE